MATTTPLLFARPRFLALFFLAVLPFLGLMCFAQPAIDDFDNAATVERLGRWGAQWYWYTHWSGRFIAIGFSTVLNPLSYGPHSGAAPTGLFILRGILLLLMLGLTAALYQLFRALLLVLPTPDQLRPPTPGLAGGLTLAVLALGLNALPEPFTMLFWYSGAMNYVLPLLLTLGFAAAALRALRLAPGAAGRGGWSGAATVGLIGAVGGGETSLLTGLLLLAGLGMWLRTRAGGSARADWYLWTGWLVAGFICAGLFIGAPGNWQRLAMADPDAAPRYHRWLLLAPRTVLTAARMAARPPVVGALLALVGAVLWSAGSGRREPRPSRRTIYYMLGGYVLLNTVGVALLKAVFMRDMWVEAMPGRVVNVLVLQLLVSTTALALWARPWLPAGPAGLYNRRVGLLSVLVVGLLVTGQSRRAWQDLLLSAADYSQQMEVRYRILDAAHRRGLPEMALEPLRLPAATGLLTPIPSAPQRADVHIELSEDSLQKNNRFLAHYYGVPHIRLIRPAPAPQP